MVLVWIVLSPTLAQAESGWRGDANRIFADAHLYFTIYDGVNLSLGLGLSLGSLAVQTALRCNPMVRCRLDNTLPAITLPLTLPVPGVVHATIAGMQRASASHSSLVALRRYATRVTIGLGVTAAALLSFLPVVGIYTFGVGAVVFAYLFYYFVAALAPAWSIRNQLRKLERAAGSHRASRRPSWSLHRSPGGLTLRF
jgi:hypothetical protein